MTAKNLQTLADNAVKALPQAPHTQNIAPMPMQTAQAQDIPIRDIHLPEAISWWPLAPGWWVMLALIILLIVLFWLTRRKKSTKDMRPSIHQQVMFELKNVYQIKDDRLFVQKLSELLKRVAITKYGRRASGLTGERWLKFLDSKWDKTSFTRGKGRVLLDLPYRKDPQSDRKALVGLVKQWLEFQTTESKKT